MEPRPSTLHPKPAVTKRFVASVVREDPVPAHPVDSPGTIGDFWRDVIARQPDYEPDKESLVIILLTARLHPFAWHRVSLGTVNETTAHPREILRPIIIGAAHGFVLVHNHPGGVASPSEADRSLTQRVRDAAQLMQVRFVDHVIVVDPDRRVPGREPHFSFREAGVV